MDVQLIADNLGKRFQKEWIFRNLSIRFEKGKIYAITGPNGSGKSTLLQILCGQLPPSEGEVSLTVNQVAIESDAIYRYISFAAPYMDLIDEFTLMEQIRFHFSLKPMLRGFSPERVAEELYLTDAIHKQLGNFSSGMKQRVKLGLCFFTDCPVMLLDEPSSNLDEKALQWYRSNLMKYGADRLVIIASNNRQEYPQETQCIAIDTYKPVKKPVT
ncbi:MAG: ABC transporter ATP-binding protein [Cyclobacteriaceae bacterium]|nr:ABC transporter ATP-binding protein [Cyclobacteriaceae bacterium]